MGSLTLAAGNKTFLNERRLTHHPPFVAAIKE
jgi:hypothetical protein